MWAVLQRDVVYVSSKSNINLISLEKKNLISLIRQFGEHQTVNVRAAAQFDLGVGWGGGGC